MNNKKKNIIITGGELFNKGAQAMLFVTVDQMKKHFPNHDIYVLSDRDILREKDELERYAFKFIGWNPKLFAKAHKNLFLKVACLVKHRQEFLKCENIYNNTDLMVDISGYALGSNWGDNCNELYLHNIFFAKEYNIPMYLLPQSFGPFSFWQEHREGIYNEIEQLLPTCKVICAREERGCNALIDTFDLKNVKLMPDIVLNNKEIDYSNIYYKTPKDIEVSVKKHSVGIVPNIRMLELYDEDKMLALYRGIIDQLLDQSRNVYVLYHAKDDVLFCSRIKEMYMNDSRVFFVDQELSCSSFSQIVHSFDYLVASRYHAIIHSYKNRIPCIIMGWADKYTELSETFNQKEYMFDLREMLDIEEIKAAVSNMNTNYEKEKTIIEQKLSFIQKSNIFDELFGK